MPRYGRKIKKVTFKMLNGDMPSLQFVCLDLIIKKFERFYFAFAESKDARLQQNFKFLQRRFSNELACELLKDRKKTDAFFEFLFNENLTIVDFNWFESGVKLKSIDDIFKRLPNLLRIRFCYRGDEILESVTKFCPRMIEIDGSGSEFTDKGIKYLCDVKNGGLPCPQLKNISANYSSVSNEGVECLMRSLPSIEKFDHSSLPNVLHSVYTKNRTQHQEVPFYNLRQLHFGIKINAPDFTDILKTCISMCPKLESITVGIFIRQARELDAIICNNLHLKELELYFKLDINIDNHLKSRVYHHLNFLRLYDCSVSVSVLAMHCPALKEFQAIGVDFTDDDDDDHPQVFFPSLIVCLLHMNPSVTKAFRLISSSSSKLETVRLKWYEKPSELISSEIKNQILRWCKNPAAKEIELYSARIEIDFIKDIFLNCGSLARMDLSYRFDVPNPDEILRSLAEEHPNRPIVDLTFLNKSACINLRPNLFSTNHQISDHFEF